MNTESQKFLVALTADQIKALVQAANASLDHGFPTDPGEAGELAATVDHLSFLLGDEPARRRFIAAEDAKGCFSIIDCDPFGQGDGETASVFAECNPSPGALNSYGRGRLLVAMLNAANATGALETLS